VTSTLDRREYQKQYSAEHSAEAAERKQEERYRKDRLRSYWYGKIVLGREIMAFKAGCTEQQIEQARIDYLKVLDETE
jgi:hypothetical protein